jgi:hypothetical protein
MSSYNGKPAHDIINVQFDSGKSGTVNQSWQERTPAEMIYVWRMIEADVTRHAIQCSNVKKILLYTVDNRSKPEPSSRVLRQSYQVDLENSGLPMGSLAKA